MDPSTTKLFDRLPSDIFRPLAASNNRRYWELLGRLIAELWGDGSRSPGEELPKPAAVRAIESFLLADDPWDEGDGVALDTPPAVRAAGIYNTLRDSGWLTQRKRGVVETVTIRPLLAQFFTLLSDFATNEPEFIGSKVRSIHLNLSSLSNGGELDAYAEAAQQAKHCMAHIANTGCSIHDLMDKLLESGTPRDFINGFFDDYIEKVFIADYAELRTKNHPLQFRGAILTATIQIQHSDMREQLVQWYQHKRARGDRQKGEALYERDTLLLMRLKDVEQQLHRLDDEIRSANQRAMALIQYHLRVPRNFDKLISRAIDGALALPEDHIALPPAVGSDLAAEHCLAQPRTLLQPIGATRVAREQPTIEELALASLRKRMSNARKVTSADLARYVARQLAGSASLHSHQLTIESISDLACYQRLLLIASRTAGPPNIARKDSFVQMLTSLQVKFVGGEPAQNAYMRHQPFHIERLVQRGALK